MTNPNLADEQEAPLDPAFEKVRRKMVRLLIISSSVIILGLMAVVFSIVYRVNKLPPAETPVATAPASYSDPVPAARQSITLPEAFVIESSSISGNRVLILGAGPDGRKRFFVHDIGTGKPVTEIDIK
jgi:hypothetical protein